MYGRTRFIVGLVTTVAFVFSFAAAVRASMCAAEVELGPAAPVAGVSEHAGHEMPAHEDAEHDCMGGHEDDDGARHCPFVPPAMGSSCAASVSLPTTVDGVTSSIVEVLDVTSVVTKPDLLFATTLFHPPKS